MCVCDFANKLSSQLTLSGVSKLISRPVSRTTRNIWCFHPGETRTHENLDFIVSISFTDLVTHEARLVSWWRLSLGILGKRDLTDWHVLNCEGTGSQRQSTKSEHEFPNSRTRSSRFSRLLRVSLHVVSSPSRFTSLAHRDTRTTRSRLSTLDSRFSKGNSFDPESRIRFAVLVVVSTSVWVNLTRTVSLSTVDRLLVSIYIWSQ